MFERLLEQIALGLESRGIPYMVIGGQALLLYGEPRLTRAIDVTLGIGPDRLPEILDFVRATNWQVLVEAPEDFVRQTMVLPCQDASTGIRIDFIFSFSAYERQALLRVRPVRIGKAEIRFVSVEDLIIHKIIAGRARDMEDVQGVLLKNRNLDVAYVHRWLQELDRSVGEKLLQKFEDLRKALK